LTTCSRSYKKLSSKNEEFFPFSILSFAFHNQQKSENEEKSFIRSATDSYKFLDFSKRVKWKQKRIMNLISLLELSSL